MPDRATSITSLIASRSGRRALRLLPLCAPLLLGGCSTINDFWVFNPNGPIASGSLYYLGIDLGLLLIIIAPSTALVLWAVYRYRRGGSAAYNPRLVHSSVVEFFAWGIPVVLVGVLSYFSVQGTEALDPYHPSILKSSAAAKSDKPLRVDVITTDWQWLFVYPKQGVALANKLVLPTNRTIKLYLTSASVTNDFYIQKLVGQIYIMPGMRTRRTFLINRPGVYQGYSADMSGPGFSWMRYKAHFVSENDFKQWVAKAQTSDQKLTYARFKAFARPTFNTGHKVTTFSGVAPHLFLTVIHRVRDGQLTHYRPERIAEDMHSKLFLSHTN